MRLSKCVRAECQNGIRSLRWSEAEKGGCRDDESIGTGWLSVQLNTGSSEPKPSRRTQRALGGWQQLATGIEARPSLLNNQDGSIEV